MTLEAILGTLRRGGIELQTAGNGLRFGPANGVSTALRAALAEHKSELFAILQGRNLSISTPEDAPMPGEWVRTPAGVGELIGWNEDEVLIQLFAPPVFAWMRADQIIGEYEAFGRQ